MVEVRCDPKDIAAATAAMILNTLPALLDLPASEQHRRFALIVEAGLHAYAEFRIPEPSLN